MQGIVRLLKRIGSDLASGKNIEGYIIAAAAIVVAVAGLFENVLDQNVKMAVLLAAVGLLVFKTTTPPEKTEPDLDGVLLDRQSFDPFREFIHDAKELWIYGPSAVNVLRDASDIKREVLDKGGNVRVLLQNPSEAAGMDILNRQLDKTFVLDDAIRTSLKTLETMANTWRTPGKVEYGLVPYNPGFSLVAVDPDGRDGRLIIEFYGFQNADIIDRMHIVITRQQSQYWFEYWCDQFILMWEARQALNTQP